MLFPVERLRPLAFLRRLALALLICAGPIAVAAIAMSLGSKAGLNLRFLQVLLPVIAVLAYRFYVHRVEQRTLAEFSSEGAVRESALGLLLGAALFTTVVAVLAIFGAFAIGGIGSLAGVGIALSSSLGAAIVEEILFRGILYRLVEAAFGSSVAIVVSAVLFGAAHAFSPNATALATIAIAIEAGVLLALAYAVTRRLWFAIGFHAGWNFTQGGVFGLAVSGHRSDGLLLGQTSGPEWLTGGSFGPEASVVAVALGIVSAAVIYGRARQRSLLVSRQRD
ncbi:MAG: CPBP family intramembrane glutamic endopeptidase [Burkholderiales bacterium]